MTELTYLTQRDLEARWQLSGRTLERWRSDGEGPPWHVIGGSIRYRLDDIEKFELRHRRGVAATAASSEGGTQ